MPGPQREAAQTPSSTLELQKSQVDHLSGVMFLHDSECTVQPLHHTPLRSNMYSNPSPLQETVESTNKLLQIGHHICPYVLAPQTALHSLRSRWTSGEVCGPAKILQTRVGEE